MVLELMLSKKNYKRISTYYILSSRKACRKGGLRPYTISLNLSELMVCT